MRSNLRCGLFTCALTLVGALLLRTTLLSHNYAEQQYHALRGHASRQAALRDARGAAAALVDAVATRPPGEAIVRGAGNATDLEARGGRARRRPPVLAQCYQVVPDRRLAVAHLPW